MKDFDSVQAYVKDQFTPNEHPEVWAEGPIDELKTQRLSRRRRAKVILISGFKRSGKDYVASILNKELSDSVVYSFAGPIKEIIASTFGFSAEKLDGLKNSDLSLYAENGGVEINFRKVLQRFGTEAMKPHFGNNVWSQLLIDKDPKAKYIIVPDFRFTSEFNHMSEFYDVTTIRINDDNIESGGMHASETEISNHPFSHEFDNTAKDHTIVKQVLNFVEHIKDCR